MFFTFLFIQPDLSQLPVPTHTPVMVAQAQTAVTTVRIIPSNPNVPIIPRGATVTVVARRIITLAHGGNAVVYDVQYSGHAYTLNSNQLRF